ncbi:hypothetical protein UPYG_G00214260 [Umbra pygmaea]|uniref:Rho GTPase-activating protein 24-like n=1 Tax=Umbra pygmaea TaxID=75934 RepID=A0ABD0WKF7_UMBPY
MELPCRSTDTPTTSSSCSTDPLYDNCLPLTRIGGNRGFMEMRKWEHCNPPVTRALPPPTPPGLAPAVTSVPTLGGGRGTGTLPAHGPCSWGALGRQGWNTVADRGGREGEREVEASVWTQQSPCPIDAGTPQSETHQSSLSVYDNLHAITPSKDVTMETIVTLPEPKGFPRIPALLEEGRNSGGSSSWSSCEILLAGSQASNGPEQYQDPDPGLGLQLTFQIQPMTHLQLTPLHAPAAQQVGTPVVPAARIPPPLPVADPSASALRRLLSSLHQQIAGQREEYEERIRSLEERNEALQGEVFHLRANLAQQRHWYTMVQAKLLESERARVAADLHNVALQREMEQFFDTFGELNNEAKKTEKIVRSF